MIRLDKQVWLSIIGTSTGICIILLFLLWLCGWLIGQ